MTPEFDPFKNSGAGCGALIIGAGVVVAILSAAADYGMDGVVSGAVAVVVGAAIWIGFGISARNRRKGKP